MATVVMRFDTSDVQQTMRRFRTRFPKALRRARKRAATSARAQLARDVAKDMKLKVGVVKENLTIRETDDTSAIYATTRRLELYDFIPGSGNPRGPYPSRGKRVLKIRGKRYPGAFVTRVGNNKWGVFKRRGQSRLPIRKLRGASIWQSATTHSEPARARGLESLQKNLASELNFGANLKGK